MKVRELKNWPAKPDGTHDGFHRLPGPEEALIDKVIYCRGGWLTFVCHFNGNLYVYDFESRDEEVCDGLKRVLEANVGKNLASIAELELEAR